MIESNRPATRKRPGRWSNSNQESDDAKRREDLPAMQSIKANRAIPKHQAPSICLQEVYRRRRDRSPKVPRVNPHSRAAGCGLRAIKSLLRMRRNVPIGCFLLGQDARLATSTEHAMQVVREKASEYRCGQVSSECDQPEFADSKGASGRSDAPMARAQSGASQGKQQTCDGDQTRSHRARSVCALWIDKGCARPSSLRIRQSELVQRGVALSTVSRRRASRDAGLTVIIGVIDADKTPPADDPIALALLLGELAAA